jgi:hypothetical protein
MSVGDLSGGFTAGSPGTATVTINAYTVNLSAATYSFTEGGTNQITVTRSDTLGGAANATLTYSDGTATVASDLSSATTTVSFGAAETSKTVTVPIVDDATLESAETFTVTLSTVATNLAVGSTSTATATIAASDGGLRMAREFFDVLAGEPFVELQILRFGLVNTPASVELEVSDTEPVSQVVEFSPGEKIRAVRVPIVFSESEPVLANRSYVAKLSEARGDVLGDLKEARVRIITARDEQTGDAVDAFADCDENGRPFGGGDGTEEAPYLICSDRHFFGMAKELSAHFALARDLDLMGKFSAPFRGNFNGSFDGREFIVRGLPMDGKIFKRLGKYGRIENLHSVRLK